MRTSRFIGSQLLVLSLLTFATPMAHGQEALPPECLVDIYATMSHEHRVARGVLFGQKKPEDLPQESIVHIRDEDAWRPWMKTADNEWATVEPGEDADNYDTKDNDEIESLMDVEPRRGLLEIRRTPTSDLIPPVTQAMRAFQCRLLRVCETVTQMQKEDASLNFTVKVPGCMDTPSDTSTLMRCDTEGSFAEVAVNACEQIAVALFERETQVVTLVMAYDAAYRSLLQFSGIFEGFLTDFRFSLLTPLWQTARAVSGIQNLPCFLSQCDL